MKKTIAILLVVVMLMGSISVYADNKILDGITSMLDNTVEIVKLKIENVELAIGMIKELVPKMLSAFSDVKESDWFKDNLALLYGLGVTEGDGLGSFLPNKELTGSEYLKMLVVALDNQQYKAKNNAEWDKPYIDRALALGIVKKGEISDFRKPLNRYNMARIIVRACKEEYGDYEQYKSSIKDYNNIPNEFKEYVLKAYSKGLINGYTDGSFGGQESMRRSEATAVIARLIDPNQRVEPRKDKYNVKEFMKNMDPRISETAVTSPIIVNGRVSKENTMVANEFAREWLDGKASMQLTKSKTVDELFEKMAAFAKEWMEVDSNIDYRNIDDYRAKAEQMLESVHVRNYLDNMIDSYVRNKVVVEGEFYTDKDLVVVNPSMGIRGTVRYRYLDPTNPSYINKAIKLNTWYEADFQLDLYINNKGEIKANGYSMIEGTRREVGAN